MTLILGNSKIDLALGRPLSIRTVPNQYLVKIGPTTRLSVVICPSVLPTLAAGIAALLKARAESAIEIASTITNTVEMAIDKYREYGDSAVMIPADASIRLRCVSKINSLAHARGEKIHTPNNKTVNSQAGKGLRGVHPLLKVQYRKRC